MFCVCRPGASVGTSPTAWPTAYTRRRQIADGGLGMHARVLGIGGALALAFLLSGCGGPGASAQTESVTESASAKPSQPAANASPSVRIPLLVPTILPPLPGFKYQTLPQGDTAALATVASYAVHPESVEGALVRLVYRGSQNVGGVYVLRLRTEYPVSDDMLEVMIQEWGQKPGTASTVAGKSVWQVDGARGSKSGAVVLAYGQDVVLIWGADLSNARELARMFIESSD